VAATVDDYLAALPADVRARLEDRGTTDSMRLPHSRPLPRELVARVVGVLADRRRAGD